MITLYEIPMEARLIEEQLEDSAGELTPELEQRIADFMAGSKDKIEAAAMVYRGLCASVDACKAEAKRLSDRATGVEKSSERLKALMLGAVDLGFNGKLKTDRFTIWGQTSADGVTIELAPDADLLTVPETYIRVPAPELNRKALQDAYKAGESLPDSIIVTPRPGTRYLRIK